MHEPHIPGPYRTSNRGTNYNSLVLVKQDAHITRNSHFVNQNKLKTQVYFVYKMKENHCKINLT